MDEEAFAETHEEALDTICEMRRRSENGSEEENPRVSRILA